MLCRAHVIDLFERSTLGAVVMIERVGAGAAAFTAHVLTFCINSRLRMRLGGAARQPCRGVEWREQMACTLIRVASSPIDARRAIVS